MSESLRPHGLQHARLPCPSSTLRAHSDSCPLSWWWQPIIWSSVIPFSSCLQTFIASGSFPMSQSFASGDQVLELQHQSSSEYSGLISFRMDWFDLLAVQGTLKYLLQHHNSSELSFFYGPTLTSIHDYWKYHRWTIVGKVMSLLLNMLSRLVIAFLSRSKYLLISWLQSPSAVIVEPKKINSVTVSPAICHEVMGPDTMTIVFWMFITEN